MASGFGVGTLLVPRGCAPDQFAAAFGRTVRPGPVPAASVPTGAPPCCGAAHRHGWRRPAAVRDAADGRAPERPAHRSGLVVLFTGLPSAGKSTVARGLRDALLGETERTVTLLDGDLVRLALSPDLSFSRADRLRNLTRLAMVSAECARHGGVVLCAHRAARTGAAGVPPHRRRGREPAAGACRHPVQECSRRDSKGLYSAAAEGRITGLTGVDDAYELPHKPDVTINQTGQSVTDAVRTVFAELTDRGWIRPAAWEHGSAGDSSTAHGSGAGR
ncbi:adenylyl-sulfate kinase [Streptacidiphilus sp. 4-A2]|nr:adenylyl-sulfate kinase [Streptacidiphilus sp. 4-A2]